MRIVTSQRATQALKIIDDIVLDCVGYEVTRAPASALDNGLSGSR
jgi:hypothetical protein